MINLGLNFPLSLPVMRNLIYLTILVLFPLLACGATWSEANEPIRVVPDAPVLDYRMVVLGEKLFHDPRLSGDGTISCASCHPLDQGGMDGQKVSTGIRGQQGPINAPTVYNASLHFAQFWDGRAATLEEQAAGPVENPLEMGAVWSDVITTLKQDKAYLKEFAALFEDGITKQNVVRAIADFERTLVTPNSPFDRYLKGDEAAIGELEKTGYRLFKAYGCSSCHQGAAVGGNMYQTMGIIRDYFQDRGHVTKADLGRQNVTGEEASKHEFKVPSLRNVALTAPYFHDGSATTLEAAVTVMGRYQIGRDIPEQGLGAIVAFLKSLTGIQRGAQ